MSWIRLRGNCPICDGARKDCRQNDETNLIHCREASANPVKWIFRGVDSLGFGLWAEQSDCDEWTEKRRQEWQEEKERRQKQHQEREKQQLERSLSDKERDAEIRKILSQLTLNDCDRQLLKNRGLTDIQIKNNGYCSLIQWQKLKRPVNNRLAGTNPDGNKLYNPCDSILCPVKNENGLYVGLRLHNPDKKRNDVAKYTWLSSTKRGFSNKNKLGEHPLAVHFPEKYTCYDKIGLSEGMEFKGAIAANRLGYPIVSFSGCNFGSSPETLKKAIVTIKKKLGIQQPTFVLIPDAGSIDNPQVVSGYFEGANLLESWDEDVTCLWWNQHKKSDGDIDEVDLVTLSKSQHLTLSEFAQLNSNNSNVVNIDRWNDQKQAEKDRTWQQLTSLTVKPWLEINTPNLDQIELEHKLEPGHTYLVLSAKGTAKTKSIKPLIDRFDNVYSWFNRIFLGREECHKLGLNYKDELGSFQGHLKTGFCANSSYQFSTKNLRSNGLLLMDESDQVLSYMFESICNKNGIRPAILKAFEAQLAATIHGNGMALFMSADNSNIEYEFLKQIAPPGCEVRVIINHYQPPKGEVNFYTSNSPDAQIEKLIKDLVTGIPCFVIDDIKNGVRGCKSVAEYIRKIMPSIADKIVEINSDVSGCEDIIAYLKNINEASKETQLLICSPSVISGISIENGHFKQAYGFFNGILTPKEASQALTRVRGLQNLNVWAAEQGFTSVADRSLTPEEIKSYHQRNYAANSKYLSSFDANYNVLTDEWSSPWFDLYSKYAAYRNLAMTDLRQRVKEKFESEGYDIVEIDSETNDNVKDKLKQTWGEINLEHAIAVSEANILTDEQFEALSNSQKSLTPQEQRDIEKTLLLKRYGQPLIDSITHQDKTTKQVLTGFAALYLKDDGGKWYQKLKQLDYLLDDSNEAERSDRASEKQQEFHGTRFAGDIRWNARKRECRKHLKLDKFLNLEWNHHKDYDRLAKLSKKYNSHIKDSIGLSVKKLKPSQIYTELISQFGLKIESKQVRERSPNGESKTVTTKRLNPISWELAQLFITHQRELRLQRTTNNQEQYSTVTTPPVFISKDKGGCDTYQSHIHNGLQAIKSTKKINDQKIPKIGGDNPIMNEPIQPQNTTENSLDSEEAIADLANYLMDVISPDYLRELQQVPGITKDRLRKASHLLPQDKYNQIMRFAVSLARVRSNANQKNTA